MKRICIVLHSFSDFYEKALPNYSNVLSPTPKNFNSIDYLLKQYHLTYLKLDKF